MSLCRKLRHPAVRDGKRSRDGKLRHPADAKACKDFDAKHSDFARETRNELQDKLE
jgi:hypothetical protein